MLCHGDSQYAPVCVIIYCVHRCPGQSGCHHITGDTTDVVDITGEDGVICCHVLYNSHCAHP